MCSQHLQLKRVDLDRSLAKKKKKKKKIPPSLIKFLKNLRTRNNFVFLCGLIKHFFVSLENHYLIIKGVYTCRGQVSPFGNFFVSFFVFFVLKVHIYPLKGNMIEDSNLSNTHLQY